MANSRGILPIRGAALWVAVVLAVSAAGLYMWWNGRGASDAPRLTAGSSSLLPGLLPASTPPATPPPTAIESPKAAIVEPGDKPAGPATIAPPPTRTDAIVSTVLTKPPPAASIEPDVVARSRDAFRRDRVDEARRVLLDALTRQTDDAAADPVRRELLRLSAETILSPRMVPGDPLVAAHAVRRGETLVTIAARHRVTPDFIAEVNALPNKDRIAEGDVLKVVRGPFSARVSKKRFELEVLLDGVPVRAMPVGLGVNGSTPTGRWLVREKLVNPGWKNPITQEVYEPDALDNPIGEYWVGLEGIGGDAVGKSGFGIHGTIEPESIGRQMSLGCVRLAPDDIEWVFRFLVSDASTVEIVQ